MTVQFEGATADGAALRYVTGRTMLSGRDPDRGTPDAERFVVLYRDDGSAVVVCDATAPRTTASATPTLSFAEHAPTLPVTDR